MEFIIYQINPERDPDGMLFASLDRIRTKRGEAIIDAASYDRVYEGSISTELIPAPYGSLDGSLETMFMMFNLERPEDFYGRSMSVSDVIGIKNSDDPSLEDGFYFVDSIGYKKIDFDPELCQEFQEHASLRPDTIRVLVAEPGQCARMEEIPNTLEEMQKLVGGYIEPVPLCDGQDSVLICNEEGKINGLPPNRALLDSKGHITDIIAGTFFICFAPPYSEEFMSITEKTEKMYMDRYFLPQFFDESQGRLIATSYVPNTFEKQSAGRSNKKECNKKRQPKIN